MAASTAALARHISEDDLLNSIVQLARLQGWLVHHCRPARTGKGWATPIQGDRGFPDLVLAHHLTGRLLFAELKAQDGRTTPQQRAWLNAVAAGRAERYEWRPSDWLAGNVQRILAPRPEVTG